MKITPMSGEIIVKIYLEANRSDYFSLIHLLSVNEDNLPITVQPSEF
jgi:hypothetical protein